MTTATSTLPRLKQKYNDEVKAALMEQLGIADAEPPGERADA